MQYQQSGFNRGVKKNSSPFYPSPFDPFPKHEFEGLCESKHNICVQWLKVMWVSVEDEDNSVKK